MNILVEVHSPRILKPVAKEAGFNPVYFSSLFKKETGINFKEYLLKKRVESANSVRTELTEVSLSPFISNFKLELRAQS